MFRSRPWVLTRSPQTSDLALERGFQLVALCGAAPVLMDSRLHDERIALTSHLPHVMASLTAARLLGTPEQVSTLVGKGFRDTTRIARGATALWSDILRANAGPIAAVLTDLQEDLTRLLAALHSLTGEGEGGGVGLETAGGLETVVDLLDRGSAGLAVIPATGPDPDALWVAALAAQQSAQAAVPEPSGGARMDVR
jgi:prephenate dehydrogenase